MLKTLARKHRSSVSKMAAKHKAKVETPYGLRRCFEVSVGRGAHRKPLVARFGGIPLNGRRRRSSTTASRNGSPTRAPSWSPGSCGAGASSASNPARWSFITSASSPTLHDPDQPSPRGTASWSNGDARPLWSAPPATTTSTPGDPPQRSRRSHWRAGCLESGHVRFGGRPRGKGPDPETSPRGPPNRRRQERNRTRQLPGPHLERLAPPHRLRHPRPHLPRGHRSQSQKKRPNLDRGTNLSTRSPHQYGDA